jgi:ABC-type lipoprotein export system ATPase subunit
MNHTNGHALIDLRDVNKMYDSGRVRVHALRDVNLNVKRGEFVTIVGPSGSGKSTLMNILGCLDTPSEGEYHLDGREVGKLTINQLASVRNKKIGFVFQNFNLLSYATAYENCEVPLIFGGVGKDERRDRISKYLGMVGLKERMEHLPTELSGGEMQRVAIARALVNSPDLILADEPTGNLDSKSGHGIIELFEQLNEEGVTVMMITHDQNVAANAKRVVSIADGRIQDAA